MKFSKNLIQNVCISTVKHPGQNGGLKASVNSEPFLCSLLRQTKRFFFRAYGNEFTLGGEKKLLTEGNEERISIPT